MAAAELQPAAARPHPPGVRAVLEAKIELPLGSADRLANGTRTVYTGYNFDVQEKIGEGTYGQVFVGNDKANGQDKVALKMIRQETENDGFPITAVREGE